MTFDFNSDISPRIDQFITARTQELEKFIQRAFDQIGFSHDWVTQNRSRIVVDTIETPTGLAKAYLFKLDGHPLFAINECTTIQTDEKHGLCYFIVGYQDEYFVKRKCKND